ncbi:MAG: hypothetical protein U9P44_00620, partial [archaeon]|nr:hypothetical protein [archaeon]
MFIKEFVDRLNKEIANRLKAGFLKEDYFITWDYNYQSEVHSRIQAIITKVCYKLGFDVEVERGFNYSDKDKTIRFKPDIAIYKDNKLFAFIEYESTNSSDARFYDDKRPTSDLRCLLKFSLSNPDNLPKYWIIISTLPKQKVNPKRWKSYEYNKSDSNFGQIVSSPFDYYFPKYVEATQRVLKKLK